MFTHIAVVRDLVDTQYKEYQEVRIPNHNDGCLLYTSDAADDWLVV